MRLPPVFSTILTLAVSLFSGSLSHAALSDHFVSTEWVADNLDSVALVDVRVSSLYLRSHLDGAVNIEKSEFLDKRRGVRSLIPDTAALAKLMDEYGITREATVVAYAEHDDPYAARLVWTLRFHGHEKAYVLDGGYEKWAAEDRPTAALPTTVKKTKGYAVKGIKDLRADADYVLSRIGNPTVVVWDTRRSSEHLGIEIRAARGGHIPGATHLNWEELQKEVAGVKVIKSEAEILSLLTSKGITPDKEIIAHCQTGIRSSYATLVLLGLGYPMAKNYDGSWTEWSNDPFFPIENPSKDPEK